MAKKPGVWPKKPSQPKKQLPEGITRALASRKPSADTEAFLCHLIEIWGGVERLAKDMYDEFTTGKPGGMTRQKILEMIQRLLIQTTDRGIGVSVKPSECSDEELDAIMMSYTERLANGNPASSSDAEPS